MKLVFDADEKRLANRQLVELASQAAEVGDRELSRTLIRVANRFSPNSSFSEVRKHEAELLLDMSSRTLNSIETELLPKLEKSDKSEEEKAKAISATKEILSAVGRIVSKLEDKLHSSNYRAITEQ